MLIKRCQMIGILCLSLLGACSYRGAEYIEEGDLVYTNYSNTFDFKSKKTFSIPDSVIKVTGEFFNDASGTGRPQMVSPTYGDVIISELKKNMAAYGWTLVQRTQNPDVVILPSAMTTTNIYYYYDWAYWGWYYPYYPGWGWYYPGYYPGYVTGYRSGSVFVQLIDGTIKPNGENIPVVWTGVFNGLAEGATADINRRITTGIAQAFTQSPYLKK